MSLIGRRLARAVRSNTAATAPDDADPRLRGRTYAIPFDVVWETARGLADGGLRGWRTVEADDYDGVIRAEATSLVFRYVDDVEIRIYLDDDAQTRVDMKSASRKGFADLGANPRRIGKFFRVLDDRLARKRKSNPPKKP